MVINKFDVLVLYSSAAATSASKFQLGVKTPFSKKSGKYHYNAAYGYLLDNCKERGLRAALSTSADIVGPGTCKSYWTHTKQGWHKHQTTCYAEKIFDKFSSIHATSKEAWNMLFANPAIKSFNNNYLINLFSDKLRSYEVLNNFAIPTVEIKSRSRKSINAAMQELKQINNQHVNKEDFASAFILKDRYGAGGEQIYKIENDFAETIYRIMGQNREVSFVLQPYMNFEKGYAYDDVTAATDIRLIYHHGKVVQTYIRRASLGDFRCNDSLGGLSTYIELEDVPDGIMKISGQIAKKIDSRASLYALDYLVSDLGNVYFLEGNIRPGLYWNPGSVAEEQKSHELIERIVGDLAIANNPLGEILS